MTPYSLFVGVDIAAKTAAVAWHHPGRGKTEEMAIEQKRSDYQRLTKRLTKYNPPTQSLVVMEATGNYWMSLALYLHQAGFVVSVINPAQGRYFARMRLQRTKTDAIDARLLAQFAQMTLPQAWTPPPPICDQLQQRLSQRGDLLKIKTQEGNRLHALLHNPKAEKPIVRRLQRHIRYLEREIKTLKSEIVTLLLSDHQWSVAARRLLAIKGIGAITTGWLLVATHNFARCHTPEQAASFAGLAPHAKDSGTGKRGKRKVGGGGHAELRKALYMAAGSAARHNPPIQRFYDRLVRQGKLKKVARCAAARKLLHIAWTVVVKKRDFDPNYGQVSDSTQLAA